MEIDELRKFGEGERITPEQLRVIFPELYAEIYQTGYEEGHRKGLEEARAMNKAPSKDASLEDLEQLPRWEIVRRLVMAYLKEHPETSIREALLIVGKKFARLLRSAKK